MAHQRESYLDLALALSKRLHKLGSKLNDLSMPQRERLLEYLDLRQAGICRTSISIDTTDTTSLNRNEEKET